MPSLKAMEYFVTALRLGSIARAAAELNIAASAVATAIDQVETAFGVTLVTRQRARGIGPTASGRVIARRCERLLEEYRALMADGAELGEALSGRLRIGYYAPVAPAFLPEILRSFVPDPEAVSLHLESCDNTAAQEGLLAGDYDVIMFVSNDVHPAVHYDTLIPTPPYCLMAADHPLAALAEVSLAQIAAEPLVVLDRPLAGAYYRALFGAHETQIAATTNSTEMLRGLVGAGRGVTVLNMLPSTDVTYAGSKVTARPIREPLEPLLFSIGYDKAKPRALVQRFVTRCLETFADPATAPNIVRPVSETR